MKKISPNDLVKPQALRRIGIAKLPLVTCGMFFQSCWRAIRSWSFFPGSGCRPATKCLIKNIPDVFYWRQIRWTCWLIKHTGVFVIQKFLADVDNVRSGIAVLENCAALANEGQDKQAQYLIAIYESMQIASNGMQLCATSMDIPTSTPPPLCTNMRTTVTSVSYSPVRRRTRCRPSSKKQETWSVTLIVLTSSGFASWPLRVVVVVEQRLDLIHVEGSRVNTDLPQLFSKSLRRNPPIK